MPKRIGTKIFRRTSGTVLNKNRISLEKSLEQKQEFGTYVWNGQYQQDPCPIEGGVIKEDWLNYYGSLSRSLTPIQLFISWDTANKTGDDNAYSAYCIIMLTHDFKFYIMNVGRERLEAPQLFEKIVNIYNELKYDCKWYGLVKLLIEDQASGTYMIQLLKQAFDRHNCPFKVEGVRPTTDKVSRLKEISTLIQRGNILFPREEKIWWSEFKKELLGFPNSKFKDQVDAFTQCINFALSQG